MNNTISMIEKSEPFFPFPIPFRTKNDFVLDYIEWKRKYTLSSPDDLEAIIPFIGYEELEKIFLGNSWSNFIDKSCLEIVLAYQPLDLNFLKYLIENDINLLEPFSNGVTPLEMMKSHVPEDFYSWVQKQETLQKIHQLMNQKQIGEAFSLLKNNTDVVNIFFRKQTLLHTAIEMDMKI